jgi:predicted TIM-barrel fold metal-dependent hydrolase
MTFSAAIIDADGHLYERDAEIFEFLEAPYAGRATLLGFPFWPTIDGFQRGAIHAHMGVHKHFHTDVDTWREFLTATDIGTAVLYPTHGLATGLIRDPEWAVALCRAYNDWCTAKYTRRCPQLHAMALLPLQDPVAAAAELERAVTQLGMVGGVLAPVGLRQALGERCYDPVYAAAERLGRPLAVHGGPAQNIGLDLLQHYAQVHTLSHPFVQMVQMTSIVMNGVLQRFPALRIAFLEAGASWIPFLIDRMDRSYTARRRREYIGELDILPSVSVATHGCYFGFIPDERHLAHTLDALGADKLLYGSDYPHEANVESCRAEISVLRERLSAEDFQLVMHENAARFYGFG